MPRSSIPSASRLHQQGAFSILTALTLLLLLLFLALVVDSGRLYMEQRRLQKVADMAALESIARIKNGNCAADTTNARLYANENGERHGFPEHEGDQPLLTQCATVQPGDAEGDGTRTILVDPNGPAVKVTASKTVQGSLIAQLLGRASSIDIRAEATAAREAPTAAFSVGAQLLRLNNNKLLGQTLKAVGLNPAHLTVLDSEGLASAKITPAGLLQTLGINVGIHELKALSPQGLVNLVNTEVGLLGIDRLLGLSAQAISDSVVQLDLDLLKKDGLTQEQLLNELDTLRGDLQVKLKDANLQLFGTEAEPGLLQLESSPDGALGSVLDTQINLGELLGAGILLGINDEGRGLKINELNVLGLAKVELGIVEPPSIGIGPVGTKAYSAQIRLYVGVDTDDLLGGVLSWLTNTVLGTRINLPIWVDVVTGDGKLEAIHCKADGATADISVATDILNICIGELEDTDKWSTIDSCEVALPEGELIKLLHIPTLSGKTHIPALKHDHMLEGLVVGETRSTSPNALAIGETVDNLVIALLDLLSGLFRKPAEVNDGNLDYISAAQDDLINSLTEQYLEETKDWKGLYDVDAVIKLILDGGDKKDDEGKQILPPLVDSNWRIPNGIPKNCGLFLLPILCNQNNWDPGTFETVLQAWTTPSDLLGGLLTGLPHSSGHRFCGGLVGGIVGDWNPCVQQNLALLLKNKPGGINMNARSDGEHLADPYREKITCSGLLCNLLKPVLELLKPILNGVGWLLNEVLANALGLELGRTDVTLHSVSCGTPQLVR